MLRMRMGARIDRGFGLDLDGLNGCMDLVAVMRMLVLRWAAAAALPARLSPVRALSRASAVAASLQSAAKPLRARVKKPEPLGKLKL